MNGLRRQGVSVAIVAVAFLLGGCAPGEPSGLPPGAPPDRPPAAPPVSGESVSAEALQALERKLTYSAAVELRAKDPWAVAERAKRIPAELGGDLLSLTQSGEGDERSARLSMRVPAAKLDEALERLRKLDAEVTSTSVDTKDVTDQFVDLTARLASKQAEEQQYVRLLAQARSVDDTLKVTQALSKVRGEIEQLQRQRDQLAGRVDYSRITVAITNVADITTASAWQPARTVAQALVSLVSLLKFLGDLVIWLIIVGWVPALIIAGVVFLRRWFARRFPAKPVASTVAATPPTAPTR